MLRIASHQLINDAKYIPLKSVRIDSKINSFAADVIITQLFRNDEENPVEAVYCFPIEENAAVYSLVATIDDRRIETQLKEKVQAQQEYSAALRQGHGAYLMEQDENSQDIFIINVGALLPGKECLIQISYVTELSLVDGNKIHFVVPTTIAPRYNPSVGTISSPGGTQTKYIQSAPYNLEFECQIDKLNGHVKSVSSTSHPISIQMNENYHLVTFGEKKSFMDRDIIVNIELSVQTNTILAVERNEDNRMALMASLIPADEDCRKALKIDGLNEKLNNEFIFIIDCSGSMEGDNKIGLARQAMILFLKSLPVNCLFNIIQFGSHYKPLFDKITEMYDEKNARKAEKLISQMSADFGGTELLEPLKWVHKQVPVAGHSRQIFLLTDGEISNVTEVIELCRSMSNSSRIFSFGLGHSSSRSLVKGLARSTNGRFTFIPPGSSVDVHVAEQLKRALEVCVTNVKVKWNISSSNSYKLQMAPNIVPPVYVNDRLIVYALIEDGQFDHSISVELWNHDETIQIGLAKINAIPEVPSSRKQLIARLAAKSLIQEITYASNFEQGSRQSRLQKIEGDNDQRKMIDLSLKYSILCSHTAFIGVEMRTDPESKTTNSNMILREIPIELPADDNQLFRNPNICCSFAHPIYCQAAPVINNYGAPLQACASSMSLSYPTRMLCSAPKPKASGCYSAPAAARRIQPPTNAHNNGILQKIFGGRFNNTSASNTPTINTVSNKTWPTNDQDIVRHLINLQKFDGIWALTDDDVKNLCKKPLKSFNSKISSDTTVLTTAMVVFTLETKYNSFQTMWSFVVDKARKRLIELLGNDAKLNELLEEIKIKI